MSFKYEFADGTELEVDDFRAPFGLIRKIRKEAESEQGFLLIEHLLSDEQLEVVDEQDAEAVNKFVEAWSEAANKSDEAE